MQISSLGLFDHSQTHTTNGSNDAVSPFASAKSTESRFADRFSSRSASNDGAYRLLSQQVFSALSKTLGVGIRAPDTPFAPTNQLGNLASQVGNALGTAIGKSDIPLDKPQDLLAASRAGVESGVESTRSLLKEQGALQAPMTQALDDSKDLLQQSVQQVISSRISVETARSSSISVMTRDGDVVEIDIGQFYASEQTETRGRSDQFEFSASGQSATQGSDLSFRVEGELDQAELRAIEKLFKRVSAIAENLFEGRMDAVVRQVDKFKFNTKELTGVAVELSVNRSVTIEHTRLTQVTPSGTPSESDPAMTNEIQALFSMLNDLTSLLSEIKSTPDLVDPGKVLRDMTAAILEEAAQKELPLTRQLFYDHLGEQHDQL